MATLVEAGTDALDVGNQVATDLVHHVVAEPLEQAHRRLRFAEEAALLLVHQPFDPVLRAVLVGLAANRPAEASERLPSQPARLTAEQPELSLEPLGEVRPQPWVGLELEGVRRLVQRDPRPERAEWESAPVRLRMSPREPSAGSSADSSARSVLADDLRP